MELVAERTNPVGRGIDLHPQADCLDGPAAVTADRRASFRPAPPRAGTERRQAEVLAECGDAVDEDQSAPHDPGDRVGEPAGDGVVVGDILEMARQTVESNSALRVGVAHAYRAGGGVEPTRGRDRHELGCGRDGSHCGATLSHAATPVRCLHDRPVSHPLAPEVPRWRVGRRAERTTPGGTDDAPRTAPSPVDAA